MELVKEAPSPARLYAAAAGALLFVLGIVGFFYGSSFGAPGEVAEALAGLRVNAWLNLLYAALGAAGLLLAGTASRAYALGAGVVLTGLGVWGLALAPGAAILGFLPASGSDEALALVLGILGLLAAAGTPRRRRVRRKPGATDEVAETVAMRRKRQPLAEDED
ncbi:MAG: DUF4383 domain-containing protein [Actinobacteria bacterium]|nr:DUF4383 domain-containing protein [Actinomycetota bacterium]